MLKRILVIVNLPLVIIGVFILVMTALLPVINTNAINIIALFLIITGAVGFVISYKQEQHKD